jgi:hypothetical protein
MATKRRNIHGSGFLVGVFAVQLGFATSAQVMAAASAWLADRSLSIQGGEGGEYFFSDLRDVLKADGEALLAEATRSTALEFDGFALKARGEERKPETAPETAAPRPDEIRGRVRDFFAPNKAVPEGTKVELLHEETEQPFSPAVVIPTDKDGNFTLLLPDKVDHFALRVDTGSIVNYRHSSQFRRGEKSIAFSFAPLDQVASLANPLGIKLQADKAQVIGSVWWSPRGNLESKAPGPHKLVARVGKSVVEQTVRVRAGSVSWVIINFDGERFPDNPTPPRCQANWPTTAEE